MPTAWGRASARQTEAPRERAGGIDEPTELGKAPDQSSLTHDRSGPWR